MNSYGYDFEIEVEEFLDQLQSWEREWLRNELDRITDQLDARDALHDEAVEELTSKLKWYVDRLETLYKQQRGRDGDRARIKERIEHFYAELRKEKRHHWRDRQELERERRDILRNLDEEISIVDLLE